MTEDSIVVGAADVDDVAALIAAVATAVVRSMPPPSAGCDVAEWIEIVVPVGAAADVDDIAALIASVARVHRG